MQWGSRMKRGFIGCLLVFGLVGVVCGEEDNVGSESQESGINFRFLEKNKRGAAKITNTDSPSFNHLTASNSAAAATNGFKPATPGASQPFRYLYNQQYYQPNPYLTYVPISQPAQYSFQANPLAHFLQTPTQIQYVAAPSVAQVPQIKYQSFATANPTSSEAASASASPQYSTQSQQQVASSAAQVSASAAATQTPKQVQPALYSDYQTAQPVYYAQQPVFSYFPQAANYIYQQPNYLFRQQQQQQLASLYGANRFAFYSPAQNAQLTYLVPLVLPQPEQDSTTTRTTTAKSSEKTLPNSQQTSASSSFSFATKA